MSSDTEAQVTSTHDPGMETADEKVVEGGEEIEVGGKWVTWIIVSCAGGGGAEGQEQ